MINDKQNKIFIGLPVFNGEKYISQSIESVLSQTYKNFILFISDNCSTDETEKIVSRAQECIDIQYQKNKHSFRFLGTDSMVLLFRDGVVRPLCKDSILFFAILRKPCGSGINIVLDKSDRMLILVIFSFYLTF